MNLREGLFKTKLSARGYAWNFSWYRIEGKAGNFEIHGNFAVSSATAEDSGVYVVDVAVADADRVTAAQRAKVGKGWSLDNANLHTFVEAKKLVIYPMLLAQFVGIVHEIKPTFLSPAAQAASDSPHFYPALVAVGALRGTSSKIVEGFDRRGFRLNIVPTFDVRISLMAQDPALPSPFRTTSSSPTIELIA